MENIEKGSKKVQNSKSWVEKYRPEHLSEIKGQEYPINYVKDFIQKFNNSSNSPAGRNKKNALMLYGPAGIGKTTLVQALAKDTDSELFELNASDLRNKQKLQEVLRPAVQQKSLTKKGKVILVDEVDGINKKDYGGIPQLNSIIDNAPCPVILTANDVWDKKFNTIRKKSQLVELKEIDYRKVKEVLIDILKKEGKFLDNEILTKIASKAQGDLRAAINDLQTAANVENPEEIIFGERNKEENIFNIVKQVLQGEPSKESLWLFDKTNMSIDDIFLWMEKNIPKAYSGEELAKAFDMLSKADVFRGRIYRKQFWRFLVYENIFLSYGISSAKDSSKNTRGFIKYQKPTRILKMWMNKQKTAKKKSIAMKYARYVHVGYKRAMHEFDIIKNILANNKKIRKELELTNEEEDYIKEHVNYVSA